MMSPQNSFAGIDVISCLLFSSACKSVHAQYTTRKCLVDVAGDFSYFFYTFIVCSFSNSYIQSPKAPFQSSQVSLLISFFGQSTAEYICRCMYIGIPPAAKIVPLICAPETRASPSLTSISTAWLWEKFLDVCVDVSGVAAGALAEL